MSQVNITLNTNTVDINTTNNQIVVTDPTNPTTVNITQPVTSIVEVITAGPQGPQGAPGPIPDTGSFVTTGSFNAFTSSYNTGSFTGSFTGSLFGTSSFAVTSSYSLQALSASYAQTASYSRDLQISGSINNVDYIDFNTGSVVTQPTPGRLSWNDTEGTLDIGLKGGNVTLQIGQEEVARVVNKTGGNLLEADYRVVRIRSVSEGGAQGGRLAIVLAQGNNDDNSATTLGVVTENIDVNQEGFITLSGQVRKINTTGTLQGETWTDGDVLYLSPTIPGYLTNIKPQAPQHTVIVGFVEYAHANNGKIFVKIDNGYEIDELHNVLINTGSLTSGQLLVRSGSVWINSNQLTGSYGLTGSLQATSFTGSLFGTSSYATNALTASYLSGYVSPFPFTGSALITGSLGITGSLNVTQGITGSLFGTSSWAENAITASYVQNAQTASYVLQAVSSSFAITASFAQGGNGSFSGSFSGSGANLFGIPASGITGLNLSQIATGSVTASVTPTQFTVRSGSVVEFTVTGTGVTIGNAITDIHRVTGSLNAPNITGSLFGTSSWAISSSRAISSLFTDSSISASYAQSTDLLNGYTQASVEQINIGETSTTSYNYIIRAQELEQSKHSTINIYNNLNFI
jgi:hypothetical protein